MDWLYITNSVRIRTARGFTLRVHQPAEVAWWIFIPVTQKARASDD
ncbi:MAG: hypothetical protein KAS32_20105 [Candidatus Peribacteraceae bacterium]|nr:hypothetical protein [Candidatus Peribacteraceae bacterium]